MTSADGTTFIIAYQYANEADLEDVNEAVAGELTNQVTQASPIEQSEGNVRQQQQQQQAPLGNLGADVDREFLEGFLSGRECLPGGSGWWRYEICYGKHVIQLHVNRKKEKQFEEKICLFDVGRRSTSYYDPTGNMESREAHCVVE